MITLRRADDRGRARFGWLDSHHSFSFGQYYDPEQMGWGPLRVINDDRVMPGAGFSTHGHSNMEIISYVLEGALQHRDSTGSGSVIRPGEVQLMSAGRGIMHSEYNPSATEEVHFLQIWIEPERRGTEPGYQQRAFPADELVGRLRLIASPDGRHGSLTMKQDALLYAGLLDGGEVVEHTLAPGRRAYVHLARGELTLNGQQMRAGDGAKIAEEARLVFAEGKDAEFLLFDLP
ncbi:pirin family protein [Thiofaba sp. EF100]|uniref:pirin family protein n=1 Tax=Thiofaba sp. EF100 TaxID=3121274 RepID=UPI0032219A5C